MQTWRDHMTGQEAAKVAFYESVMEETKRHTREHEAIRKRAQKRLERARKAKSAKA